MAQFTMQMRAVTNLESCGQAVAASRENGFGKVGIAAAASRLASGSQGWRPAAVTHLRVAAARHVTFQRQCDLLLVRASEEPNGEGAGDDMSGLKLGETLLSTLIPDLQYSSKRPRTPHQNLHLFNCKLQYPPDHETNLSPYHTKT